MAPSHKSLYVASRIIIACAFVACGIYFINIEQFTPLFQKNILFGILACQVVLAIEVIPLGLRLAILVRRPRAPLAASIKAAILSIGFNVILPARLSEFIKPIFLRSTTNIPFSDSFSAIFIERVTDILILSALTILAILSSFSEFSPYIALLIFAFCSICLLFLPIMENRIIRLFAVIPYESFRNFLSALISNLSMIIRDGRIYKALIIGSFGWACSFCGFILFMFFAGPIDIGFGGCLLLFVVTTFGYAIPALPAGIGTYEAGAIFVLNQYGYEPGQALILGIGLHFSQLSIMILMTVVILLKENIGISVLINDVRALAQERRK